MAQNLVSTMECRSDSCSGYYAKTLKCLSIKCFRVFKLCPCNGNIGLTQVVAGADVILKYGDTRSGDAPANNFMCPERAIELVNT